ncbi:Cache 3/Cache 2 fusion domain-containing protein [Arcobacter lanthieri]|uniref:methyl-accepting chemotaxis protein n=1 Tax=Aliarcobacter lanthieri TaxID=1355374 RepID=UPI0019211ED9|nr:methyl-accepting chemotaxis protein [Aliarcobacter lanthieri]MBL3519437.1 Cache 3/Cache 2 fusion domain-containing protein [Aliarcobacter lanthieri]
MSNSKKLLLTMFFNIAALVFIITVSFTIANKNINNLIKKDLETIGSSIYSLSSIFIKNGAKAYENKEFKDAINSIRIGKSGYVYFIDETGKIVIHPSIEGQNLANLDFIQKILSDKNSGIIEYYTDVTNQDKMIFYKYIPEWKVWLVPGINKDDYVKDIYFEFFYKIVVLGIILIIIQIFVFFITSRGITKNINNFILYFKEFLNFVTYKQNKIEKRDIKGNCEFSKMSKQINDVIDEFDGKYKDDMRVIGESILTFDKLRKGVFRCRIKSTTSNPMINTLKNTINEALDDLEKYMKDIENILMSYTNNNYKSRIDISKELIDESRLLKVMKSVNILGDTLSSQSKQNLNNGNILENNSKVLKSSIEKLTTKLLEQTNSLEFTTQAVDKISNITKNNTQNALQMSSLGEIVKKSVEEGYNLTNQTNLSMDEINSKVLAINEAISIIDQISFQTNILSLNAAVEAATAGEAGKGFAVVAQEVRSLANKSSEAANDIKNLVDIANLKANEGKEISNKMQEGYKNLFSNITQTLEIIQNVSSAANEQRKGIEEVNQAIITLEKISKENEEETIQVNNITKEVSEMAYEVLEEAKNKIF